jgi:Family of unknown function (DUF5678)
MPPTATIGRAPVPKGLGKRYAGKWVALRGNKVVAWASTFEELTGRKNVRPSDAFYQVPKPGSFFY